MAARRPQPFGLVPVAADLRCRSSSTMSRIDSSSLLAFRPQAAPALCSEFLTHHTNATRYTHALMCGVAGFASAVSDDLTRDIRRMCEGIRDFIAKHPA